VVIKMALTFSWSGFISNPQSWVLIAVFIIGALALIPQYVTVTSAEAGYLLLAGALLTLALKVFSGETA
jgi:uncharacterized protein (DUF486 family)